MYKNLIKITQHIIQRHKQWEQSWPEFTTDPTLTVLLKDMLPVIDDLQNRLSDSYPFFHPLYAGQMLKPPHPAAVLGYFAAMLINSNNHALDGGPATSRLEKELLGELATMFGYRQYLGHLTSSGTVANLEALWMCRQIKPDDAAIAFSDQSHYTHQRMCEILGVRGIEVPSDAFGRMDMDVLERLCLSENIGAVVATIGTTGLGALDPLPALLQLRDRYGFRIHADAAYGGFFSLIGDNKEYGVNSAVFGVLSECNSIVVDPHKHGLQPYGCGCVIFRNPDEGRYYLHDSPYTYFTSDELHLGEISLECSRAGATAAALWSTLRILPLQTDTGLGAVLRRCRNAALKWAEMLRISEYLCLLLEPELDIVVYFPNRVPFTTTAISAASARLFETAMNDKREPVYLSTLRVKSTLIQTHYPRLVIDSEWTTVLRSVLMKPEQADWVERIHTRIEKLLRDM